MSLGRHCRGTYDVEREHGGLGDGKAGDRAVPTYQVKEGGTLGGWKNWHVGKPRGELREEARW